MHVGRPYPYNLIYYATEAWFWPGFVPHKLWGELTASPLPPFNVMPFPWTGISDPGVVSADEKLVTYEFAVFPPAAYPALFVSLDRITLLGEYKARWRATLADGSGAWGTAFLIQDYPQRVVYANGFDYTVPAPPYTGAQGPPFRFRPALYSEGGTPYPDY